MRLKRYQNGDEYITGGIVGIEPNGVDPVEEYDLSELSRKEVKQLMKNKKNKTLRNKARRIVWDERTQPRE